MQVQARLLNFASRFCLACAFKGSKYVHSSTCHLHHSLVLHAGRECEVQAKAHQCLHRIGHKYQWTNSRAADGLAVSWNCTVPLDVQGSSSAVHIGVYAGQATQATALQDRSASFLSVVSLIRHASCIHKAFHCIPHSLAANITNQNCLDPRLVVTLATVCGCCRLKSVSDALMCCRSIICMNAC